VYVRDDDCDLTQVLADLDIEVIVPRGSGQEMTLWWWVIMWAEALRIKEEHRAATGFRGDEGDICPLANRRAERETLIH
jgi:hypothetical protein